MGTMKDTPEGSELRQRAEKELETEAGSTERFPKCPLKRWEVSSTSFRFIRLS